MPDKNYKQIVILSGKGGTGKTTISSALSKLVDNKIMVDCDVDAANLYLLLDHEIVNEKSFQGGFKASIDKTKCTECGLCESVCRFDAIHNFEVDQLSCEGCGFCYYVCPDKAVTFEPNISGSYYECKLKDSTPFYYAKLKPGEGNSGKLVSEIKKQAKEKTNDKTEWIIIDGPPGIGCPVNASLAGADFVVLVTEPSLSGFHDVKRIAELLSKINIKCGIIINKYDLNHKITNKIIKYSLENTIPILGTLPFNPSFTKAIQQRKTIVEVFPEVRDDLTDILKKINFQLDVIKTNT